MHKFSFLGNRLFERPMQSVASGRFRRLSFGVQVYEIAKLQSRWVVST